MGGERKLDIIKRILRMLRPHTKLLVLGVLCLLCASATRLIMPIYSGELVDDVVKGGHIEKLVPLCGAIMGLTVLRGVTTYIRGLSMEKASQNFVYDLRTGLYHHLSEMPYEFYDKNYVGEIMSRMTGDIEGLRELVSGGFVQIIENSIWFFGSLFFMFFINWKLALVMLAMAPVTALIAYGFQKRIRPAFRTVREQNAVLSTKAQENISGVRVVKAFAREEYEKEAFAKENRKQRDLILRTTYIWSDWVPFLDLIGSLYTPLLLGVGAVLLSKNQITLGDLVTFTGYIWMIANPMRMLGNMINMITQAITSGEKLFYYSDLQPAIKDKEKTRFPEKFTGHVTFDHVTFAYGDHDILKDVSFDVPAGKTFAVMGATGSGKTSVVNLLARFYECRKGRVMIDGVDVKDMPLKKLRDRIGFIMQETFLFSETLENNIRFGRPKANKEQVERAAKAAQALEFIHEIPKGYDTIVGERGLGLSGGQKQRIALARALCYDPTILILDDATSAVDMETEFAIQKELETAMKGRTTFIIAHRISSVKNADEIIVLKDGEIAERGNHNTLLEKKGLYYQMYLDQYRDFEQMKKMDAQGGEAL